MKYWKISLIFIIYYVHGENTTELNTTSAITMAAINNSNVTLCTDDQSKNESEKCLTIKNDLKPTHNIGGYITLILLGCLMTIILTGVFVVLYRRLNQRHRNNFAPNTINTSDLSSTNDRNHLHNILRPIGFNNNNQRRRFNIFSRLNNTNNSLGQRQQTESLRTPLNDHPDEALLFDDPYADGGLNSSSANPYKSLTLAVT